MKQITILLVALLLMLNLAACSQAASTATTVTGVQPVSTSAAAQPTQASASTSTAGVQKAAAVSTSAAPPVDTAAVDDAYDPTSAVPILLQGSSASASASGVQVNAGKVTITAPGTYTLSGTLEDGQIVVNSKIKGTVRLILNGVDIHSSTGAPIDIIDAGKVVIVLADNTANVLTDGVSYVFDDPVEEEPNAALFSKADLTIYGSGALTVNANFKDGIASKDGLLIAGGAITVSAADDGMRGKDYLAIKDGILTVNAKGDGLKSDNAVDAALGYISIAAGTFQISAGGDAINAQTTVSVSSGTFTLTSGGGSSQRSAADTSTKGIKGSAQVVIDGGAFTIDAADDTLHSNGSITINGGTFSLASADDGMHADEALTINGGDIRITSSYEGLESTMITINDGTIHLVSSDDGINGAAGNDASGATPGQKPGRGGPGQDAFSTSACYLYIHGGYIYVDALGDGIDINGAIEMTAGVVLVNGPTQQMNGALDYDAGFKMTGGFIVAAGSSGMAMTTGQTSSQPAILVFLKAAQAAGTLVHIQNSAGEDILTFAPTKQFQSIAFSSPALAQGETYTVFTGGSASGTATDGLYQGGSYTPGAQAASFTASNLVTTAGTGGIGPRH